MHTKRRQNNTMNGGTGNNGQHRHQNNRPRRFNNNGRPQGDGNDPANVARTRRNATQSKEKYQMMARDAMQAGDRVLAEYYLQHADHYHRILLSLPPEEVRPQFQPRNNYNNANAEQHAAQGDGATDDAGAQEGNGHSNGHSATASGDNGHVPASHELPAFITQPHTDGTEEQ
jgi:hypothetical protein